MASFKVERRSVTHNGRTFSFITYDKSIANPRTGEPAKVASWFLVNSSKRWEVTPYAADQLPEELDRTLVAWLDANVFP